VVVGLGWCVFGGGEGGGCVFVGRGVWGVRGKMGVICEFV